MMAFKDRYDGGKQLVERLLKYKGDKHALVLGLARGGARHRFRGRRRARISR